MGEADIRIRVLLDDLARQGLYGINTELGRMGTLARDAGGLFGGGMDLATKATMGFVLGIGALLAIVGLGIKSAADYQMLLVRMARATNATTQETQQLGNTLMSVGSTSIFSLQEIADGFVRLGQRGISAKDIINGVGQAGVYLAEATGTKPVDAMDLLGTTMAAFHIPASQALRAMALLQYAFEHGVPSISQLQSALGTLGGEAVLLHVPLDEVVVMLGVLGRALGSGAQAGTALRYMMQQLAHPATSAAADEFKKYGITLFDAHGQTKDFISVVQELAQKLDKLTPKERQDALATMFNVRSGKGASQLIEQIDTVIQRLGWLRTHQDNVNNALQRAHDVENTAAGAWQAFRTNMQDVLTLAFYPFLQIITPFLLHLRDLAGQLRQFMAVNPQVATTFVVVALALGGAAIAAFLLFTGLGQIILIAVGIIALAVGIAFAVNWMRNNFMNLVHSNTVLQAIWNGLMVAGRVLWGVLKDIGSYVVSQFSAAWQQVQQLFAGSGIKMENIIMVLKVLGGVILAIVVVSLGILVGVIHAVINGLAFLFVGISTIIMGIGQVISGFVDFIKAIVNVIIDVIHGNWSKVIQDTEAARQALIQIVTGLWNIIVGIFTAVIGTIVGIVMGFVHGVVSFFTWLYNVLVGRSIVPEMLNLIVQVFANLPGRVMGAIGSLLGRLASFFGGLASQAVGWGVSIISNLASGIINSVGSFIGNAMSVVGSFIHDHFPHSPAKLGPLRDLRRQGELIPSEVAAGIMAGASRVSTAAGYMAGAAIPTGGGGGRGSWNLTINLDGKTIYQSTMAYMRGDLVLNAVGRALR